jgi:hypothetical protein
MLTTRRAPKGFAWSYSKLKNYDTCPKRHYEIDVAKNIKEADSEQLLWGNQLHAALAARLSPKTKTPLPNTMHVYEDMMARLDKVPGEVMVECKFAITKDFAPCGFFDNEAWYRGIADVLIVDGPVAFAIDYKTGKVLEDSQQLALMAACIFAHFPSVLAIRTEFWWLKDDATSRDDFRRRDMPSMWRNLWPRIEALEQAHKTLTFPPKPGGLCRKYCPVVSCPHHGK